MLWGRQRQSGWVWLCDMSAQQIQFTTVINSPVGSTTLHSCHEGKHDLAFLFFSWL